MDLEVLLKCSRSVFGTCTAPGRFLSETVRSLVQGSKRQWAVFFVKNSVGCLIFW